MCHYTNAAANFHTVVFCGCEFMACCLKGHDKAQTNPCVPVTSHHLWYPTSAQCPLLPHSLHPLVESERVLALCNWAPGKCHMPFCLPSNFLTVHLFCTRTSQDPLVHHGRHFGRAVHAFCNMQMLIMNGLHTMSDDAAEDETLTAACIAYSSYIHTFWLQLQWTQGASCFLGAASISPWPGGSTHVILRGRSDCDSRSGVFSNQWPI